MCAISVIRRRVSSLLKIKLISRIFFSIIKKKLSDSDSFSKRKFSVKSFVVSAVVLKYRYRNTVVNSTVTLSELL